MRSLTRGNFRVAAKSLRTNKGRSFLTMLGIIIGVSSVIVIVGIGQGIRQQVGAQINHVGKNLITVRPSQVNGSALHVLAPAPTSGALTSKDVDAVQKSAGVASVAPLGIVPGTVQAERGTYRAGPVVMTSPDFPQIVNQSVAYGTFFSADDGDSNIAVLGATAATEMFNENVPLGQTFTFRGQEFMVRGILNDFPSAPLSSDVDFNNTIFISYPTGQNLTHHNAAFYEILAKSSAPKPQAAERAVNSNLSQLHGDSQDFSVLLADQAQSQTSDILNLLTELITGVAAISLLVGGIGIMNIMLVSVTERLHEIGIRKAVGATNRQILSEFMAEATVLSVVGSILGIILAVFVTIWIRILTALTPTFDWKIMVLAALVAIIVGILFGTAPALKAARKDPITALRGE